MKKLKIYCLLILILSGCNESPTKKTDCIAKIENGLVKEEEIDSIISEQIYRIKKDALKTLLKKKAIGIEAQKLNISEDSLLNIVINRKTSRITEKEYAEFIKSNGYKNKNIDSANIVKYLVSSKKQKVYDNYTDSLLWNMNIEINLKAPRVNIANIKSLDYQSLSSGKKLDVFIFSDYNCPTCIKIEEKLRNIIDRYGKQVSFRFVYFTSYIDRKALIAEAAANQGKFREMHDFLFDHPKLNPNSDSIFIYAEKCGIDRQKFEADIFDPNTMQSLINNKIKILEKNIFVTPTFIVNNRILNDEFAIFSLKNTIEDELSKKL